MKTSEQSGFFFFSKPQCRDLALKEMLQFLRANAPGRSLQFAYVESETSLLPHLSLWENLHVIVGGSSWEEFVETLEVDWHSMVKLIRDPHVNAVDASNWEKLTVGLLKATLIKSQHILIDINEEHHTPLNLQNFKKILLTLAEKKNVFIASAAPELWLDSSHTLITREGYKFLVEDLNQNKIKRTRTA